MVVGHYCFVEVHSTCLPRHAGAVDCLADIHGCHCATDASDLGAEEEETSFVAPGVVVVA